MTRWELFKAANGSLSEWYAACEKARDSGWTLGQVQCMLHLSNPVWWLAVFLLIGAPIIHFISKPNPIVYYEE